MCDDTLEVNTVAVGIGIVGSCVEMCPPNERAERIRGRLLHPIERRVISITCKIFRERNLIILCADLCFRIS